MTYSLRLIDTVYVDEPIDLRWAVAGAQTN
jgi:hypothetical protein